MSTDTYTFFRELIFTFLNTCMFPRSMTAKPEASF